MKKLDAYRHIMQDAIREGMSDKDILMLMVVFHLYGILLRPEVSLEDVQPDGRLRSILLAPLTRTHLADLFASLWPKDDRRGNKDFWFWLYDSTTPYEGLEDIPPDLRPRVEAARDKIARNELVADLIED